MNLLNEKNVYWIKNIKSNCAENKSTVRNIQFLFNLSFYLFFSKT